MFVRIFLLLMLSAVAITVESSQSKVSGHVVLHHLFKRWNEEIFGCHCSFTIHCTSDSNCHAHGHQFRCVADCCGTKCHAVSESTNLHHGRQATSSRFQ